MEKMTTLQSQSRHQLTSQLSMQPEQQQQVTTLPYRQERHFLFGQVTHTHQEQDLMQTDQCQYKQLQRLISLTEQLLSQVTSQMLEP